MIKFEFLEIQNLKENKRSFRNHQLQEIQNELLRNRAFSLKIQICINGQNTSQKCTEIETRGENSERYRGARQHFLYISKC